MFGEKRGFFHREFLQTKKSSRMRRKRRSIR